VKSVPNCPFCGRYCFDGTDAFHAFGMADMDWACGACGSAKGRGAFPYASRKDEMSWWSKVPEGSLLVKLEEPE
jgi:hypothetical protein